MKKSSLALFFVLTSWAGASADVFDFKDAKGVNNIAFMLDAPLESISGTGNDISGTVNFDPKNPSATTGSISLKTESLMVTNSVMRDHMLGAGWLDAKKHPEITFTAKKVTTTQQEGKAIKATVVGDLTLKGITKEVTAPITFTHIPGKLADRTGGKMKGDLLVIRADFPINRSEFGIKPGENTEKVAETINIRMSLAGACVKE